MKRNWMIVLTVMILLTLSCRLPLSRSSRAADQTITDQDLYDEGTLFVSPEGVTSETPSQKEASDIDESLPWIGSWVINTTIKGVDCYEPEGRAPHTANCANEIDIVNRGDFFHIFETQEESKSWLDRRNEDRPAAARYSVTLDYPVFKMSNPHFVEKLENSTTYYTGHWYEGTYDPVTDTFSGDFQIYFPIRDYYDAMITGTWTATRR